MKLLDISCDGLCVRVITIKFLLRLKHRVKYEKDPKARMVLSILGELRK